jgi:hypothetical protein
MTKGMDMPGWSGCDVCLTGFEQTKGGFAISTDYVRHLKLPTSIKAEDLQRAQKDCEILAGKIRSHPEEMSALLAAALRNDVAQAKELARKLGMTEEAFANEGGGFLWIVVIVVLLIATDAY